MTNVQRAPKMNVAPSLEEIRRALAHSIQGDEAPKFAPVVASISGELHTPTSIYLKLKAQSVSQYRQVFCVARSKLYYAELKPGCRFCWKVLLPPKQLVDIVLLVLVSVIV